MKSTLNFYYPSIEGGGLEKNLFSLINSLAKKKYKINFFTYENNIKKKEFKKKFSFHKNINVISSRIIPGVNHRYLKYIFCFFNLLRASLFRKNTIISFQNNILAIIVAKITFNNIIIRCNTAPSKYIDNTLKKKFFTFFYSLSDIILVTSYDFKKEINKYFGLESKVHRQTLDVLEIKKKSKVKFNFNFFNRFNGLKIINIGRLTDQKDQLTLLKAFSNLIKYRKARLLIIGNGNNKKKLLNFVKKNKLNDFVKFIPFTNNPFKYLSVSNVKVLSSKYEGNPNILLETACLKKLIISTNCKVGPREILQSGKGGILFKVGDYHKLFLILKKVDVNSYSLKSKINTSYNYVKQNFQKDISNTFLNLVKHLI